MPRTASNVWLAGLCLVVHAACHGALAAKAPPAVQLPAAGRVGVISLLDAEVTHFHASRQIENSYLKTYAVSWSVPAMLITNVRDAIAQRGLTLVPLAPNEELSHAREECFLDAALAKGLPKECARVLTQLASVQHLDAMIILGPGRNDAAHADGARHRELPEYLRGWCFVSGQAAADAPPTLLNLTELLLIGVGPKGAQLADREWGGDGGSWVDYHAPADLKAFAPAQLDALQPLFGGLLKQQADALLGHLQAAH
jgi:hypothetical protein